MVSAAEVSAVQRLYPQVYLACHVDHVRRKSTPHGLTSAESSLLAHLTLSAALQRLEHAGCIHREPSRTDRRTAWLRLTEQGETALGATSVLDAERVRAVLETLDTAARAEALRGLSLLAQAARRCQEEDRFARRTTRKK